MIRQAKEKYPKLNFHHSRGENVHLEGTFDIIILSDLLNNIWDVQELLAHLQQYCDDSTRIVINAYSRLWQPFLNLARKIGLAAPMLPQNWLTVDDVKVHINRRLNNFKKYFSAYTNYKVYGGVAYINIDSEADVYAAKQGLFVLGLTGDNLIEIKNEEEFVPVDFGNNIKK